MIWKKNTSLEELDQLCEKSAIGNLGIKFTDIGSDWLEATMVVEEKCCQPMGYIHGGVSVVVAESVGSLAGFLCVEGDDVVFGTEINASHLRPVKKGQTITARATLLRLGRAMQVWDIVLIDDKDELFCSSRLTVAVVRR